MTLPDDGLSIIYRPAVGPPQRVVYESTADGVDRVTFVWTGCSWRCRGREPVEDVHVEEHRPPTTTEDTHSTETHDTQHSTETPDAAADRSPD